MCRRLSSKSQRAVIPNRFALTYVAETLRRPGVTRNLWCLPLCQSLFLDQ